MPVRPRCVRACALALRREAAMPTICAIEAIPRVTSLKAPARINDFYLAVLQRLAILVAEHREQHLVDEVGLGRVPVDIEKAGKGRTRPVLQDVPPPEIGRVRDAHVI